MVNVWSSIVAVVSIVGCIDTPDPIRIDVTEQNALGVSAVTFDHVTESGNDVFNLRALSADDRERVSVRITRGVVTFSDQDRLPGSEIVVSAGGKSSRAVTRELGQFIYDPTISNDAQVTEFLTLPPVSHALERQAAIVLRVKPASILERAYDGAQSECDPSALNTSPLARQCCMDFGFTPTFTVFSTTFFRSDTLRVYVRYGAQPLYGWDTRPGCVGQTPIYEGPTLIAYEECAPSGCYYGPNGFSKAVEYSTSDSAYPYPYTYSDSSNCVWGWGSAPTGSPSGFGDVNGTFSTGQTCPAGAGGGADWDY